MRLSFKRDVSDELEMHVGETQTIVPIATSVAISYTHTHTMAGPLQGLVPLTGALRHNARLIPRRGPYAHSRSRPYHYTLARTEEKWVRFRLSFLATRRSDPTWMRVLALILRECRGVHTCRSSHWSRRSRSPARRRYAWFKRITIEFQVRARSLNFKYRLVAATFVLSALWAINMDFFRLTNRHFWEISRQKKENPIA